MRDLRRYVLLSLVLLWATSVLNTSDVSLAAEDATGSVAGLGTSTDARVNGGVLRPGATLPDGADALMLVPRADASLFAVQGSQRVTDPTLLDVSASNGDLRVTDVSTEITPAWSPFEGSEASSIAHTQLGQKQFVVETENRVGGRLYTAYSENDGMTWKSTVQAFPTCSGFDGRLGAVNGHLFLLETNDCTATGPVRIWKADEQGHWKPAYEVPSEARDNSVFCSTPSQMVWLYNFKSNPDGSAHSRLAFSTDGVHWSQLVLPAYAATNTGNALGLACGQNGFVVYNRTDALQWNPRLRAMVSLNMPITKSQRGKVFVSKVWISNGVILVETEARTAYPPYFSTTLSYSINSGQSWRTLLNDPSGATTVSAAAVSSSGDIYAITGSGNSGPGSDNSGPELLWSTAARPAVLSTDVRQAAQQFVRRYPSIKGNEKALAPLVASDSLGLELASVPNAANAVVTGCSKPQARDPSMVVGCKIRGFANIVMEKSPNGKDWVALNFASGTN